MKKNLEIILLLSILLLIGGSGVVWLFGVPTYFLASPEDEVEELEPEVHEDTGHVFVLSSETEAVLHHKLEHVAEMIAENEIIIEALRKSNDTNALLTIEEKINLDAKWRKVDGIDDFISSFLQNPASFELYIFQENNPGYPEIFITDVSGLNIAQTNKTTDYYQADEEWWVRTYNDGKGEEYHGAIEYDESAQSESVSLYLPIYEPGTEVVIGVVKAVADMVGIKKDLHLNE